MLRIFSWLKPSAMKQFYSGILMFLFFSAPALAQKASVKGILVDTTSNQPVGDATISLLNQKDSSLVSFTMTDDQGRFEIKNIGLGGFRLIITHVNYHTVVKNFKVDEGTTDLNLSKVPLTDRSKVLDEVIVTNEAPPVTLVGDTVQYNAGSFKVQPNATVEELLKKLPGVKVDKDGNVKAQGEKVSRVLVDGKEFFGNDPKLATKNLPADAVDKVQVYNKQSDQSQLTGFDDGNSEKTINLKLKQDKKKGNFGKINAGAGTDDRYQGHFNFNSFRGGRQLSAIGTANNTNIEGFSIMDILNFTGEMNRMMKGSGAGGNINISIQDEGNTGGGGSGTNTGINTIWGGGVNYNNTIGKKTDFTSNYFYNHFNPVTESDIVREYLLPDSLYYNNQHSRSEKVNVNHRLNLSADYQIDSFTSLKVTPSFSYQETTNNTTSNYQTLSESLQKSNEGFSNNSSGAKGYNLRTDILFRKKFKKKGRTFSISIQSSLNNSDGNGNLSSINRFFARSGNYNSTDTINQQNKNESSLNGFTGKLVYTEPIFKRSLLEFSLGKSNTKSVAEKTTWDFNPVTGKYDQINSQLTNNYQNQYGYNNAGIRIRKQSKKFSYSTGILWQQAEMEGKIFSLNKDSVINKSFSNLLPNARFQYYFSKFKNIQLNYSTYTNQPTAAQLQPVADNTDPLNIKLGNPDLKQEYTHFLQTNLFLVSPYRNRNLFAFLTFQQTQHKIVNYDRIDSFGIKTSKPVNVNGVYTLSGDINWGFPVHFLKGTLGIGSNANIYHNKQFINGSANNIQTSNFGPEVRLDASANDKLEISLNAGVNYNYTKYSLQPALNTTYFSQHYEIGADWQLPKKLFMSTDFIYTINSQRATGFNSKVPFWNAAISRQVLKYNRGEIKLSVHDLLNQNIGISRTSNQNYIEDSRITTIRRFFLLSFTYSLSKMADHKENAGGNLRIISR